MGKEVDKEDERKESAIASTPALRPNFNPKGITQTQLAKFQELHMKRLEIKSKSKFEKKKKAGSGKSHRKKKNAIGSENQDSSITIEKSTGVSNSESPNDGSSSFVEQHDAPKKQQKLHWGLDTKERWERKANM